MSRVIEDKQMSKFPPMVGLRAPGNFVKGKVVAKNVTAKGNPCIDLTLIEMDGSTSQSISRGKYEEVSVEEGDLVQLIGSVKQLKDKLPLLEIGDVVTVTFVEEMPVPKGKMKVFKVVVD